MPDTVLFMWALTEPDHHLVVVTLLFRPIEVGTEAERSLAQS